jgi:hypothetical protein
VAQINASTSAVIRVLKKHNIHPRRAARKLYLSPAHAEQCLFVSLNYVNMPAEWWEDVIFSDEKSFWYYKQ